MSGHGRCQLQSGAAIRDGEDPAHFSGELLALGVAHHPEQIPRVMDLASLVSDSLQRREMAAFRPWCSSETISSTPRGPAP